MYFYGKTYKKENPTLDIFNFWILITSLSV